MLFPILARGRASDANTGSSQKGSRPRSIISALCAVALFIQAGIFGVGRVYGGWTPLATLAPDNVELMLLLPDGTVMAANAYTSGNNYGSAWYRLTPDNNGHYVNGTWSQRATASYTRLWCSSQVLQNGKVMVAGGEYGTGGSTAELYDPVADAWSTVNVPPGLIITGGFSDGTNKGFRDSGSVMLANGTVLIAPVYPVSYNATLVYDPVGNTFSQGPAYSGSQNEASWLKLADSSILTVDKVSSNCERFIPRDSAKWSRSRVLAFGRFFEAVRMVEREAGWSDCPDA